MNDNRARLTSMNAKAPHNMDVSHFHVEAWSVEAFRGLGGEIYVFARHIYGPTGVGLDKRAHGVFVNGALEWSRADANSPEEMTRNISDAIATRLQGI